MDLCPNQVEIFFTFAFDLWLCEVLFELSIGKSFKYGFLRRSRGRKIYILRDSILRVLARFVIFCTFHHLYPSSFSEPLDVAPRGALSYLYSTEAPPRSSYLSYLQVAHSSDVAISVVLDSPPTYVVVQWYYI